MTVAARPDRIRTPRVALVLVAITVLLYAATFPLAKMAKLSSLVGGAFMIVLFGFVGVGLILVRTRPRNPIGWSMLGASLLGGVTAAAGPYAVAAYRLHDHLPLPQVAVFLQPAWAPVILLFALSIMLFPDGELPSGRWRWAMWAVAAVGSVWMIGAFAIAAETIALGHVVVEPTGDLKQIDYPTAGWAWWSFLQLVWFGLLLCVGVIWLISRVPAYRAATGERRQQLKWLIFGGSAAVVGVVLSVVLSGTLAYALLTGLLIGVFVGLVLLTTRVLPFSSPVGVAASTLAALALFNPLHHRIQRVVDRRFNRAHYDAEQTIAAFATSLRGAADVDTVLEELAAAAGHSLEPAHLTVWTRT